MPWACPVCLISVGHRWQRISLGVNAADAPSYCRPNFSHRAYQRQAATLASDGPPSRMTARSAALQHQTVCRTLRLLRSIAKAPNKRRHSRVRRHVERQPPRELGRFRFGVPPAERKDRQATTVCAQCALHKPCKPAYTLSTSHRLQRQSNRTSARIPSRPGSDRPW